MLIRIIVRLLGFALLFGVAQAQTPQPHSTIKDCAQCPEMVVMPKGTFMMGASKRDLRANPSLKSSLPRHPVIFDYTFAIGRFEVTVDQFAAYVKETGDTPGGECQLRLPDHAPGSNSYLRGSARKFKGTPKPGVVYKTGYELPVIIDGTFSRPGHTVTGQQPATCISRREVMGYLAWLSKKSRRKYRLPSEAEWEYAVRAGTASRYHFGNKSSDLCKYANFADRGSLYSARVAAACTEKPSVAITAAVGSFRPNKWGLHDMLGNVFEMVADCATDNYDFAPDNGAPDFGEQGCKTFASRGFLYDSVHLTMYSAARCTVTTMDGRSNALGVRVAVTLGGDGWDKNYQ